MEEQGRRESYGILENSLNVIEILKKILTQKNILEERENCENLLKITVKGKDSQVLFRKVMTVSLENREA